MDTIFPALVAAAVSIVTALVYAGHRFGQLEGRFSEVTDKIDSRFDQVDSRFLGIENHLQRTDDQIAILNNDVKDFRKEFHEGIDRLAERVHKSEVSVVERIARLEALGGVEHREPA